MTKDLEDLVAAVEKARERFIKSVESLGAAAATSSVDAERWTAGQYTEHLVRAEEVTIWRMWSELDQARSGGETATSETPDLSIEEIVERTWQPREQAPPLAVPSLGGAVSYWLERLRGHRQLLAAFADALDDRELDAIAYLHPISGPFTLRQGLQFIRFHLERHLVHVEEIKAQ